MPTHPEVSTAARAIRRSEKPYEAARLSNLRDLRIDFARGIALLFMLADHMRNNLVGSWTPRNFAFFDMADVFVFLSGLSAAIKYTQVMRDGGLRRTQVIACKRVAYILVAGFVTLVVLRGAQLATDRQAGVVSQPVQPESSLPTQARALREAAAAAEGSATILGILPLYVVLITAAPGMIWLNRRHWSALLMLSSLVYGLAQVAPRFISGGSSWMAFDPFAWQFLFALAIVLHSQRVRIRDILDRNRLPLVLALLAFEGSFLLRMFVDGGAALQFADKASLGILRVGHLFSAIVLARACLQNTGNAFWQFPVNQGLLACGQASLAVFCAGTVLVALANRMSRGGDSVEWQILAVAFVWIGSVAIARCSQRARAWQASQARRRIPDESATHEAKQLLTSTDRLRI